MYDLHIVKLRLDNKPRKLHLKNFSSLKIFLSNARQLILQIIIMIFLHNTSHVFFLGGILKRVKAHVFNFKKKCWQRAEHRQVCGSPCSKNNRRMISLNLFDRYAWKAPKSCYFIQGIWLWSLKYQFPNFKDTSWFKQQLTLWDTFILIAYIFCRCNKSAKLETNNISTHFRVFYEHQLKFLFPAVLTST